MISSPAFRPPLGYLRAKTPRFQAAPPAGGNAIASQPVVQTMLDMIQIPSATPQADPRHAAAVTAAMGRMKQVVEGKFRALGVTDITHDPNGSLIVRIPGSPGLAGKRPLMMTAHMDIVAGDENDPTRPIRPQILQQGGRTLMTSDGATTLGADDKGGLAMILDNVARLLGKHPEQTVPLPHAPLELVFSPDEESTIESLKSLDTSRFHARHVLVVDEFEAFKVTTGLASAVKIAVRLDGFPGGHSGADIDKPGRPNAIALLAQMLPEIGTGVIEMDPVNGIPAISKNIGLIQGGRAMNAIPESAEVTVFLRSASPELQQREIQRIQEIVNRFQSRFPQGRFQLDVREEYPAWQGDPDTPLKTWASDAARAMGGPSVKSGPIHAAAQASILANKTNARGEKFDAVLIGPDIEDAHTVRERIDLGSLVQANRWLGQILQQYARNA